MEKIYITYTTLKYGEGAQCFHFLLGPANYVADTCWKV